MKITIFPGKYHQTGGFLWAMLVSGRVIFCKLHDLWVKKRMVQPTHQGSKGHGRGTERGCGTQPVQSLRNTGPPQVSNIVCVSQGSLNYLYWGDQTIQIYGNFEGFPL